jgi:hypothetical protein
LKVTLTDSKVNAKPIALAVREIQKLREQLGVAGKPERK